MTATIEDLGIAGHGEANLDGGGLNLVRHPATGAEFAVLPTLEHAFILIDPRERTGIHVQPDMSLYQRTSRTSVQGPNGAHLMRMAAGGSAAPMPS